MRTRLYAFASAVALSMPASQVHAENLDVLMSQVFSNQEATYIGFESVEREDIPEQATSA